MIDDIPKKYHKLYNKRKVSRKAAIRSFCLKCMGYEEDEVKVCTDLSCEFYSWRLKG